MRLEELGLQVEAQEIATENATPTEGFWRGRKVKDGKERNVYIRTTCKPAKEERILKWWSFLASKETVRPMTVRNLVCSNPHFCGLFQVYSATPESFSKPPPRAIN